MSKLQLAAGAVMLLVAFVGVVLADTGGGGCHADVYWDTNGVYYIPWGHQKIVCKKIDCSGECPPATDMGGGWLSCLCPGMGARCNAAMKETASGAPLVACFWSAMCPEGEDCEMTTDTPSGSNPYGPAGQGGYEKKFTCWCE